MTPALDANYAALERAGHYQPGMIHYGGDWYWGIDRLSHLEARLRREGLDGSLGLQPAACPSLASMIQPPPGERPRIEVFVSFRSPYSYLSLRRIFDIADAFGLELRIRPVLPMVMRGLPVPRNKLLYIVRDAWREAERLGIAFGPFADTVGEATERSCAVFYYAQQEKREREFVLNLGKASWSQAVDVATDKGMRKVTGRTGLFWPDVVARAADG